MKLELFKNTLRSSLESACKACLARLNLELADETIYAFTIYCSSGYTTVGVAVATQEALFKRNALTNSDELQKFVNMMNASEWKYVNCHYELFDEINRSIDEYYDTLFDGEFEDYRFDGSETTAALDKFTNDIFSKILVEVLQKLKADGCFVGPHFTSDILFGLQFGDPTLNGVAVMEDISAQVNSRMWHERVVRNCSYYRTGLLATPGL